MSDTGAQAPGGGPPLFDPETMQAAVGTLQESRFSATSGDGRVKATVTGEGRLVEVDIDPLLERHHHQKLAGWLQSAITDARGAAREQADELIGSVVGDRAAFVESAAAAVPWLRPPTRAEDPS